MRKLLIPALLYISLALSACTTIVENIPGVYSIDIQQGNIINQEIVDQLRPNMNKRQVLYIMGTPMLRDVFHHTRWEYIFSEQPGGNERLQKRLSLYFDDDKLIGVQGDFRPSNIPVLRPTHEVTIDLPKREQEKTMSDKVVDLFTFDDPKPPVTELESNADKVSDLIDSEPGTLESELTQQTETPPIPTDTSTTEGAANTDADVSDSDPSADAVPESQQQTPVPISENATTETSEAPKTTEPK